MNYMKIKQLICGIMIAALGFMVWSCSSGSSPVSITIQLLQGSTWVSIADSGNLNIIDGKTLTLRAVASESSEILACLWSTSFQANISITDPDANNQVTITADGTVGGQSTIQAVSTSINTVNSDLTITIISIDNMLTSHTITEAADRAKSVYAADVNGDGDMDILSASDNDNKIAWYKNNGDKTFTNEIIITTGATKATCVYAADVNGDGNMDVLSASSGDNKIAWYENDGSEGFTTREIATDANGATSVYAADVDGDGNMDVLSASWNDNTIAWYENNGSETFKTHIITTNENLTQFVYAADVDSDGDMDVLSASFGDNKIRWYTNNGDKSFTNEKIIFDGEDQGATSVYAIDVDGDGDMDVLSSSVNDDDKIAWHENDGSENFTKHTINTDADSPFSVYAADVDGDGDMDVLSASHDDDKIKWYENQLIP